MKNERAEDRAVRMIQFAIGQLHFQNRKKNNKNKNEKNNNNNKFSMIRVMRVRDDRLKNSDCGHKYNGCRHNGNAPVPH